MKRAASFFSLLGMAGALAGRPDLGEGCCECEKAADSQTSQTQLHIFYEFDVKLGRNRWTIRKRFSDFVQLIGALQEQDIVDLDSYEMLPPKTWFVCIDEDFLEERRNKLSEFVDHLMNEVCKKGHMNVTVARWLQIDPY